MSECHWLAPEETSRPKRSVRPCWHPGATEKSKSSALQAVPPAAMLPNDSTSSRIVTYGSAVVSVPVTQYDGLDVCWIDLQGIHVPQQTGAGDTGIK